MKVLTYTSYKEHYGLYTVINGSIAVNGCEIGLAQKDITMLSMISVKFYKVGKRTGIEKTDTFINFRLSADTYSIDDFNTKSRKRCHSKDRNGNHLKLKTECWSFQNTMHS